MLLSVCLWLGWAFESAFVGSLEEPNLPLLCGCELRALLAADPCGQVLLGVDALGLELCALSGVGRTGQLAVSILDTMSDGSLSMSCLPSLMRSCITVPMASAAPFVVVISL